MKIFVKTDALDKKSKPLVLKWLSNHFGYKDYPHSFKDQWINWRVWDGELTVGFDSRVEEQNKLKSMLPVRLMGTPQHRTLKIVNEDSFYLRLETIIHIYYPDIISSSLVSKIKQQGGTRGWHSPSDDFYTYDWEVVLSDGSSIMYHNQEDKMDMIKGSYIYNAIIQEREFLKFLNK